MCTWAHPTCPWGQTPCTRPSQTPQAGGWRERAGGGQRRGRAVQSYGCFSQGVQVAAPAIYPRAKVSRSQVQAPVALTVLGLAATPVWSPSPLKSAISAPSFLHRASFLSPLVMKALTVGKRGPLSGVVGFRMPHSGLILACPPDPLREKARSQGHEPNGSVQPLLLDHTCNMLNSGIFSHPKPACFQGLLGPLP